MQLATLSIPTGLPSIVYQALEPTASVEALANRVHKVKNAISDRDWHSQRYALFLSRAESGRFQYTPAHETWHGRNRICDKEIIRALCNRVQTRHPHSDPVRVLEIAAGSSFGNAGLTDAKNYGSPWLSRALQLALASRILVLATDTDKRLYHEVERDVYGLHSLSGPGASYGGLASQGILGDLKFDFIFGRHLPPHYGPLLFTRDILGKKLHQALAGLLLESGSIYVNIDHTVTFTADKTSWQVLGEACGWKQLL